MYYFYSDVLHHSLVIYTAMHYNGYMITKDKVKSIRINEEVFQELEKLGLSPQKIIDQKIAELFKIEVKITVKEDKQ